MIDKSVPLQGLRFWFPRISLDNLPENIKKYVHSTDK